GCFRCCDPKLRLSSGGVEHFQEILSCDKEAPASISFLLCESPMHHLSPSLLQSLQRKSPKLHQYFAADTHRSSSHSGLSAARLQGIVPETWFSHLSLGDCVLKVEYTFNSGYPRPVDKIA